VRNSFKLCAAITLLCNVVWSSPVWAWGDEGHEVIALIAQSRLDPVARKNVEALLAADPDTLTAPNIADAATWADKFRDSDRNGARQNTRMWHFVDLELSAPNLDRACFGHPALPAGALASNGPAQDCVVDKIEEFAAELANPATDRSERIVALKFLLHLVGDLHQPLHASDDHDRGGNDKRVSAVGMHAETLHHYWDTDFVEQLGPNSQQIATTLIAHISATDVRDWALGNAADWAMGSFKVAKDDAYGQLPAPDAVGKFRLADTYVAMADRDVALQLSKAGVRLAVMLNRALGQGNKR
jgi:S1/P1 Nuclease